MLLTDKFIINTKKSKKNYEKHLIEDNLFLPVIQSVQFGCNLNFKNQI